VLRRVSGEARARQRRGERGHPGGQDAGHRTSAPQQFAHISLTSKQLRSCRKGLVVGGGLSWYHGAAIDAGSDRLLECKTELYAIN
jgi:hypothetical protein